MFDKYSCTKCGSHPSQEKEIFFGCSSCGNKLFKIKDESSFEKSFTQSQATSLNHIPKDPNDSFTSIEVEGTGVYHVNITRLVEDSQKANKSPLLISDQDGVYHIKL